MAESPPLHDNRRLSLAYQPIESVHANPRDPRIYSRSERRRAARMVEALGPVPVIVTPAGVVVSGNIWLEAAKAAGLKQIPVITADYLSAAEADALMLASVKIIENGKWDDRKVGEILRELTLAVDLSFDIDVTGFDVGEIDLLINGLDAPQGGPDPADILPPAGPPVSRMGDLWLANGHRVGCMDALESESFEGLMEGRQADGVMSDAPYNVPIAHNVSGLGAVKHGEFAMASGEMSEEEFAAFLSRVIALSAQHSRAGAVAYWFMDWRHIAELMMAARPTLGKPINLCVWSKTNAGMGSLYRSQHELIAVFRKPGAQHRNNVQLGRYGRSRGNIWSYPGANSFGRAGEEGYLLALHPTVKPVALIVDALLDTTARGELVLDPFLGSGSTLIAAERVGRRCYGLEISPVYVDCIIRRWQSWTGEVARLASTGQTFAEVAEARGLEASNG